MWSEPDSVAYTEPLGCIVVHSAVYILWRGDSVPVLSLGRLVGPADLRGSLGEPGPGEEESRAHQGVLVDIKKIQNYSPALNKQSRLT